MNSFALHFVVLLLIGSQFATSTSASATSSNNSSTTQKPPSLPSPPVLPSLSTLPTRLAHDHHHNHDRKEFNNTLGLVSGGSIGVDGNLTLQHKSTRLQTTKTPRMIQRLVAGHLHLQTQRTTFPTTSTSAPPLFRSRYNRKPYQLSSSYRRSANVTILTTSTTPKPETFNDDDEAFLEDSRDSENWDNGILRLSAGGGKELGINKKKDSTKTLAEQVKDGKYGLIEKELFSSVPERPGVLSYLRNKEVPDDNERNFGGLDEEDIWLAEDHLLVLKGGDLNEKDNREPWPPLDDYVAPERQIKIPPNPKVPPPFPVQFEDNGPIQFIGNNKFPFFYPLPRNESLQIYPARNEPYSPPQNYGDNEKNTIPRAGVVENSANPKTNSYLYPAPYPPWLKINETSKGVPAIGPFPFLNGSLENRNISDFDEDDQSLYYPPPYSFVYKSNYTNLVPPGPLVPGIVLPPPPNAFARLKPKSRPSIVEVVTYTPKTIIVTPITTTTLRPTIRPVYATNNENKNVYYSTTITPTTQAPQRNRITEAPPQIVQIQKQVLYAVPPERTRPSTTTTRPDVVAGTLKANPIYYEYYDKPTTPKPQSKGRRPIQNFTPTTQPPKKFLYEDYVYITPKPESRPNDIGSTNNGNYLPFNNKVAFKNKQIQSFEHEINVIRQALNYYRNQQYKKSSHSFTKSLDINAPNAEFNSGFETQPLRDNNIPRTPKSKPFLEFSFEEPLAPTKDPQFNAPSPTNYDVEPFQPMVTYSPPVNDANGFQAITYAKSDEPVTRPTPKLRVGAKYLQAINYDAPMSRESYDEPQVRSAPLRQFNGYQYPQPQPPSPTRQNNRFYDEPFVRQINPIRSIINNYKTNAPQVQQPLPWSLENDTYVNYLPNHRPPQNPNSEFINSYQPQNHFYSQQSQRLQQQPQHYLPNRLANQQQPISLHRDTLVNYRYPLPPINPDSEYIPLQINPSFNRNSQIPPPPFQSPYRHGVQYRQNHQSTDQSNVYYVPHNKRN